MNLDVVPGELFLALIVLLGCQLLSLELALDILLPDGKIRKYLTGKAIKDSFLYKKIKNITEKLK